MLFHLLSGYLHINIVRYLTFRTAIASLTAFDLGQLARYRQACARG